MTTHQNVNDNTGPRIYVGASDDYELLLPGRWIDADQPAGTMELEALEFLGSLPGAHSDWAIYDSEGFGTFSIGERADCQFVSAVAELVVKHGEAFTAWCAATDANVFEGSFEDAFLKAHQGAYESLGAYAQHFAEELELMDQYASRDWSMFQQPTNLANVWPFTCIDWERAGRELVLAGDIWAERGHAGVFVFRAN